MAKAEYLGGYPYASKSGKCNIFVTTGGINVWGIGNWFIHTNWISSVEAMTEEQVRHDVTLTRFLLMGLASVAMKKKRVDTSSFLTVNCTIDGSECSILFRTNDAHKLAASFNKLRKLNQLKANKSNSNSTSSPKKKSGFSFHAALVSVVISLIVFVTGITLTAESDGSVLFILFFISPIILVPVLYRLVKHLRRFYD